MIVEIIILSIACGLAHSSGVHDVHPVAAVDSSPVVTAASSQYFERVFNRLVQAAPVFEPLPFLPAPQPAHPVVPAAQPPPVVVEATRTTVLPAPPIPPQNGANPNIAIAIATAHAAPVATILLPPYPFGLPPAFVLPQPANDFPTENPNRESTTPKPTLPQPTVKSTQEPEVTTALPSNIDNGFIQALPSAQNINFRQYQVPPQQLPVEKPQKIKTNIEIVPVPLTYIAPPPLNLQHHHHDAHHHSSLKAIPHFHTFIPKTKIIIRPVSARLKIRTITVPAGLIKYKVPSKLKYSSRKSLQTSLRSPRDPEPTTFRPFNRPFTKPPRL
ncbi:unnamed protein product [Leptidea sinapis]|uniref:DUF4794 domain-containing protein n=1 Tax=Leptidea sinapis TaxID=189913 RepID=A0A5E4QWH7_9NEOP|nr:unnamed protein product [Leptidea sinapis]